MDGFDVQALQPTTRADLGAAFPEIPIAACSGFSGDVVLPDSIAAGRVVRLGLTACFAGGDTIVICQRPFIVVEPPQLEPQYRSRNYELYDLLEDPKSGRQECLKSWLAAQDTYDPRRQILAGVPHFHPAGSLPLLRPSDHGPTHPYGPRSLALIEALPTASLFLDLGSGIKSDSDLHTNAVYLEAVHFRTVDVVSTCPRLPFREGIFNVVISQAVFEHLPSPSNIAREILRVLKPGGKVLIDTAFMQPLHGDPNHYYNMTMEGLRLVLRDFEILEEGIQPYQMPSFGLRMQIEAVLPFIKVGSWKTRLEELLDHLRSSGDQLDRDLGPVGQSTLAAGVFAVARRPVA